MSDQASDPIVPKPVPIASEASKFYWDGAKKHRFCIQKCEDCSFLIHPPKVICPNCASTEIRPEQVTGRGTIYSYTIVRRMFHPAWSDEIPYVIALVDLNEQDGLRVVANIIDADESDLRVGMPVEVMFEDRGEHTVPQFKPIT